jgi:hypothetical protein
LVCEARGKGTACWTRAQSAISRDIALPEGEPGLQLFDRSARKPHLTDTGKAALADARPDGTYPRIGLARTLAKAGCPGRQKGQVHPKTECQHGADSLVLTGASFADSLDRIRAAGIKAPVLLGGGVTTGNEGVALASADGVVVSAALMLKNEARTCYLGHRPEPALHGCSRRMRLVPRP